MHWFFFFALLLFYCLNVPIIMAFSLDETGYGFGFSAFSVKFAMKKADKRMVGRKSHIPPPSGKIMRAIVRAFMPNVHSVKLIYMGLRGELGLSDAAKTAKIIGAIISVYHALRAAVNPIGEISLYPNFVKPVISVKLRLAVEIKAFVVIKALARWIKSSIIGQHAFMRG